MSDAYSALLEVVRPMLHNTLDNYIVPGLRSSLVGDGKDKGKVRLFHASRDARDFITPHSHRFNFAALVLEGTVVNSIYHRAGGFDGDSWVMSTIGQVCGMDGIQNYTHVREEKPEKWRRTDHVFTAGMVFHMSYEEIHSIVYHRNAKALFLEGPPVTDISVMLEPWVNGKLVPTFKTEDWMFEKA